MKKKILFVTNDLVGGGAENILRIIALNLNRSKYDATICSLHEICSINSWPDDIKYIYIYRHRAKNKFERVLNRIGNKFKLIIYAYLPSRLFYMLFIRGKYDTEVAFIEGYATRIISGSTNAKSKKIAWLHTDMKENHWSEIAYTNDSDEIRAYKNFDKIVGVSNNVAQSINKLFPSISSADIIYNPIDELDIIRKSQQMPLDINPKRDVVSLVSVGRLVEQKGYDRLIPIISSIIKKGYNIDLTIVGEGNERPKLQKLIDDNQLNDHIKLLGHRDNPYPYMTNADAFICSSRTEGFSTVVTEALILGLPVVTTDCAGMRELLGEESEYGIITENNELALELGIEKLLQPGNMEHYRQLAQTRGADFNLKSLMAKFEACL